MFVQVKDYFAVLFLPRAKKSFDDKNKAGPV
ncbi:hypothetical protein FHW74_001236 [Atlantibacter sp. RC6]|nr:hypothetical protein [Atlantibacter sp. RC6]